MATSFPMETPLERAIEAAGSQLALARGLGISHQAVAQWERVPAERVAEVERITGIPREQLRPDIFRKAQKKRGVK